MLSSVFYHPYSQLKATKLSSIPEAQSDHIFQLAIPLPQPLAFHRTFGHIRIGRSHLTTAASPSPPRPTVCN